jgi:hypothetical protein
MERSSLHPLWSPEETNLLKEAEAYLATAEVAEREYFARLPLVTMSCCPFDGRPLIRTFDPYGCDGLWWRSDAQPAEVPSCPHFCVLLGAVHCAGNAPEAGDFEVHPGPQVPYVVPRLLAYPTMVAVISHIQMANGYRAYPVAYFAAQRPPPQELTAGWARTNYVYTTQLSQDGWRIPNDPWDFDLLPWLRQGKIRWCPVGSENSVLSTALPETCPYLELPGERQRMVLYRSRAWRMGLPTGEPLWPIS